MKRFIPSVAAAAVWSIVAAGSAEAVQAMGNVEIVNRETLNEDATDHTITITWKVNALGIDPTNPPTSRIELRYRTDRPVTDDDFPTDEQFPPDQVSLDPPQVTATQTQTCRIRRLKADTWYYFGAKGSLDGMTYYAPIS